METKPQEPVFCNEGTFYNYEKSRTEAGAGLTKMEWLTGLAMQGFLSNPNFSEAPEEKIAELAKKQARLVIEVLNE